MIRKMRRRTAACLSTLVICLGGTGCGLLDANDPTAVEESELANPAGADMARRRALQELYPTVGKGALVSALLTDEFFYDPSPNSGTLEPEMEIDRRDPISQSQIGIQLYEKWHEVRRHASVGLSLLREHGGASVRRAHMGQMLAVRGYATLALAENFCAGFPLHEVVDGLVTTGAPLTTDAAFGQALADFDSAVVYAADSARILNGALVGRARTLLGLGRFAEAATAAAAVPTDFTWEMEFPRGYSFNPLSFVDRRRSVADREGGTGLDYVAANDSRVEVMLLGTANDGVTNIYGLVKYANRNRPIVLASGIEARLVEAEAALNADSPQWLTILNDLRRTWASPALPDTTDPGTAVARADLLFRERAFWLFATGHRLGDLRRLVQHYGRTPETVFPAGAYRAGGTYGTTASLPFPTAAEAIHNPAVTGCLGS